MSNTAILALSPGHVFIISELFCVTTVLLYQTVQAMAKRKDLEKKKNREYRLTAFTGDLPLGSY